MKGALSYRVELGSDVYGNLQRIENVLKDIPNNLTAAKAQLEDYEKQTVTAKEEMVKPFPQEEELQAKSARLAELNAELNMDGQHQQQEETESNDAPEEEIAKAVRPASILERLNRPCPAAVAHTPNRTAKTMEAR